AARAIIDELGWKDRWFTASAIGREGTWPIMLEVMAFFDRQRQGAAEADGPREQPPLPLAGRRRVAHAPLARTRLSARAAGAGRGAERGRGEGLLLLLPTNQKQQQKQPSFALRAPRSAPRPSRGREGARRCASQWLASASTHPASGRRERGGSREGQAQKTRPEPGFFIAPLWRLRQQPWQP